MRKHSFWLEGWKLEHGLGIRGTYYFRFVKASWNETVMRQITEMTACRAGFALPELDAPNALSPPGPGLKPGSKPNFDNSAQLKHKGGS